MSITTDIEDEVDEDEDNESSNIDVVQTYFRDLARRPVLSSDEELALAQRIETLEVATWEAALSDPVLKGHVLTTVVQTFEGFTVKPSLMSPEALREIDRDKIALKAVIERLRYMGTPSSLHLVRKVEKARAVAKKEFNRFVEANLRLVVSVTKKFPRHILPFADMVAEGNLGLLKAVDRFDWREGYRFSTYATWWIRQNVARALAKTGRMVRLPVHIVDGKRRLKKYEAVFTAAYSRPPTEDELAKFLGISVLNLRWLRTSFNSTASLDETSDGHGGPGNITFLDKLVDDRPTVDFVYQDSDNVDQLREAITMLGERDRRVIELLYFENNGEGMTLEEAANLIGRVTQGVSFKGKRLKTTITRERVRQIELRVLETLRRRLQKKDSV